MAKDRKQQSKKSYQERRGPAHSMRIDGFQDPAIQRGHIPNIILQEQKSDDGELIQGPAFHLKPGAKILEAIKRVAEASQIHPDLD